MAVNGATLVASQARKLPEMKAVGCNENSFFLNTNQEIYWLYHNFDF